jgi:hypothetical protein
MAWFRNAVSLVGHYLFALVSDRRALRNAVGILFVSTQFGTMLLIVVYHFMYQLLLRSDMIDFFAALAPIFAFSGTIIIKDIVGQLRVRPIVQPLAVEKSEAEAKPEAVEKPDTDEAIRPWVAVTCLVFAFAYCVLLILVPIIRVERPLRNSDAILLIGTLQSIFGLFVGLLFDELYGRREPTGVVGAASAPRSVGAPAGGTEAPV